MEAREVAEDRLTPKHVEVLRQMASASSVRSVFGVTVCHVHMQGQLQLACVPRGSSSHAGGRERTV